METIIESFNMVFPSEISFVLFPSEISMHQVTKSIREN